MDKTIPGVSSTPTEKYVGDRRWELVERVASSTVFRKSPRLRQFLLFVAERRIAGHSDEISEYEIGWNVFERGPNYNPVDDSIVRSAARQLRSKVKEYFETEGIDESLIFDIPKGAYVPVFFERVHLAAPLKLLESPSDGTLAVELRRWKILAAALAAGIIALVGFGLWKNSANSSVARRREAIVSTVLTKDQTTRVVLGDAGLSYVSQATKHLLSVAEYANHSYPKLAVEPPFQQIWDRLTDGTTTYLPEVKVAATIMRMSSEEGKNAVLLDSRQLSAQDFRSGNMIVISAPSACPWIHLLEDKLNFRYMKTFDAPGGAYEFRNLRPQPGEEASYSAGASVPQFGRSYGVLARVPNLSNNGKVLLIYGFKTSGAQAAAEYATDPRAAAELARALGVRRVSELPDFEVLLSTDSMASTPLNVHVVAYRIVK